MPPPFVPVPLCKTNWYFLYTRPTRHEEIVERWLAEWGPEFGRYRCQHPLGGGKWIPDFALLDLGVLIEVDGKSHASKPNRVKDAIRDSALSKLGWVTLRVTNDEVESIGASLRLASRIREVARGRGPISSPGSSGRTGRTRTSPAPGPTEDPSR